MRGKRIPVWIPIQSLGAVNVYVFSEGPSVSLVDSGMLTGKSILDLLYGLRSLGYKPCDVERILLTHFHVDHSSMAALFLPCGTEVFMSDREASVIEGDVRSFIEAATSLYKQHGVPQSEVDAMLKYHPALSLEYAYEKLKEAGVKTISDGDRVKLGSTTLRVISTPGHTPGSIVLLDEEDKSLYTGDTLLPEITPHVTLHDPESDPLEDYMESLRRIIELAPSIAYPGHRETIGDPAGRALELLRHHEERLNEVTRLLESSGGVTAYDVARRVKWRTRYNDWSEYPPQEKFFAMGETLAHLKRLEVTGRARPYERGGVYYWRT